MNAPSATCVPATDSPPPSRAIPNGRGKTAPGPRGHPLWGALPEFRRDALGLLAGAAATHGDIVRLRFGPVRAHLLNHPAHAAHVLVRNRDNYDKRTRSTAFTRAICGESVLTAEGEGWTRCRQRLQPHFHGCAVRGYARVIGGATEELLDGWRRQVHGAPDRPLIDFSSAMMRLTFAVAGRCFFNAEVAGEAAAIEGALERLLDETWRRIERPLNAPAWCPTPGNRRFRRALATIDASVGRIIDAHRAAAASEEPAGSRGGGGPPVAAGAPAAHPPDLLSVLMAARDPETGEGLSDGQLRNETLTLLLAGHETTANALTWTAYLLACHPAVQDDLAAEVRSVLGGRAPGLEDLDRLPLNAAVLREGLRLNPPVWIIERRAVEDDVVGGYRIPAGSSVLVSPYTLHRHPGFWEDPGRFDPSRFLRPGAALDGAGPTAAPGLAAAYLPFGAGPRFCLGQEFAQMEARLVLAALVRDFRLHLPQGGHPVPKPGITLRARDGLRLRLEPRPDQL